MSKNARLIDYRLRLGKYVERRMLCSAFQRLAVFSPLHKYRYIGFGAYYFTDFYLFHKELGISKMISIEKSSTEEIKHRYEFNKPFECIEIHFDTSSVILPQLDWKQPTITWLDYTEVLTNEIIGDVDTVSRNALSGNIFILTLRATGDSYNVENQKTDYPDGTKKMDVFHDLVGHKKLTEQIKSVDLTNKNISKTFAKIIYQRIKNVLYEMNAASTSKLEFIPLFNFKYKDGVPMYSFGGIYIDKELHGEALKSIEFSDLDFVRGLDDPFDISIPNLTLKEIKYLESLMPAGIIPDVIVSKALNSTEEKTSEKGVNGISSNSEEEDGAFYGMHPQIPKMDLEKFKKIYKFFPTFAETRIG